MYHPELRPRRRWPLVAIVGAVVLAAAVWAGIWFYAAARARTAMEGWRAREARIGRFYDCASRDLGGFPFRIEVKCAAPTAEWRTFQPPFALRAKDIHVAAQVYDPTLLIAEIAAPLHLGEPNQPPSMQANWRLAQVSLRGTPRHPQRVSMAFDAPRLERMTAPVAELMVAAEQIELHGRMVAGSADANPVIEMVVRATQAAAPALGPLSRQPFDLEIESQLTGLKDFSAKPWTARLREVQARGGKLEIVRARLRQGEVIAVANGLLGLTPSGHLDGELQLTVAHLDKLLPALGVDQEQEPQAQLPGRLNSAVNALNRLAPGLGDAARERAGPALVAGANLLGTPTELEGQRAVRLPLRFDGGKVRLGPLRIGRTPALF